ncbi:4-oxalocrotonate tautomerase [Metarhizobium album]|uniref:Tautomerase n=1 Tax=Metarhizobium album TaxID=2182425 RepID=A0A2U2DM11_9HYPH|nr:2-hydroxymuconate tautomerase [Rhizobium album]PWE54309.1 4-oxalocrotonate tautomerase [Rhizobium album]
MPIITVNLLEGRTRAQKEALFAAVTDAVCETLSCPPEQVRIIITDMEKTNFAVAGKSAAAREEASQG